MSLKGLLDNAIYIGIVIFVVGAITLAIDKMAQTSGLSSGAAAVLNNGSLAIGSLVTSYGTLIVTMVAIGVLLRLILGSFDFGGGGARQ